MMKLYAFQKLLDLSKRLYKTRTWFYTAIDWLWASEWATNEAMIVVVSGASGIRSSSYVANVLLAGLRRLPRARDRAPPAHCARPQCRESAASGAQVVPDPAQLDALRTAARSLRAHPQRRPGKRHPGAPPVPPSGLHSIDTSPHTLTTLGSAFQYIFNAFNISFKLSLCLVIYL